MTILGVLRWWIVTKSITTGLIQFPKQNYTSSEFCPSHYYFWFFIFFWLWKVIQHQSVHSNCSIWHDKHFGVSRSRIRPQIWKSFPQTWIGTVFPGGPCVSVSKKKEWVLNPLRILLYFNIIWLILRCWGKSGVWWRADFKVVLEC